MKKIISVLLSVIMIFSLVSVSVSAAEEELLITVANDLHYSESYANYSGDKYAGTDYSHAPTSGQLKIESDLIIDAFLAEVAQGESDIILLPGDLVDRGTTTEHAYLSAKLVAFEAATGKRIYVVPGNHDYNAGVTPEQFEAYYAEFGYNEAIAKDTESASYVVELNDEYRLIAIDSCTPGEGGAGIDETRKAWIEEQAKKAQEDGKKLISMMHHNLLNHFIFGDIMHPGTYVDDSLELAELYAQYNIKYNFVAHTHSQDIKAYTGENGVTVYDVLTSSLNLYPVPYRTVSFGEDVEIKTKTISEIDMTSKQGIISDNCYNLACEDFEAYALKCLEAGLDSAVDYYGSPSKIKSMLKLDETEQEELCGLIDEITEEFITVIDMPLYEKDAAVAGESIQTYAKELDLELPETDFYSCRDLAIFFYTQYILGDENFGFFSDEFTLFTAALTTVMNYLLKDLEGREYAMVLDCLCDYLSLDIPESFLAYAGNFTSRIEGIDLFVATFANTVFLHFTTDEVPADNNATLPGYEEPAVIESELSLWERLVKFFREMFDYILRIFGVGK